MKMAQVIGIIAGCQNCTKTTQTCCQNHTSHCSPKYATFKDYAIDGGEYREVKICDSCRCADCTKIRDKMGKKKNLEKSISLKA